ncbi:MAG: GNAT family N-acetyltransferase [Gemmatimonadota bacterium]
MRIEPATPAHLAEVRAAYTDARAKQAAHAAFQWPVFTERSILDQMESGQLLRVIDGDAFVGVFTVAYEDPAIWGELERGAHVYLHRFARASTYKGRGLVDALLGWSIAKCEELGREGLRLDTWGHNDALIAFYESRGFTLVETRTLGSDPRLASHYDGLYLALLERPLALISERTAPPASSREPARKTDPKA